MSEIKDPNLAVLIERVDHIAQKFDELARGVDELRSIVQTVHILKTDVQYTKDNVKQLSVVDQMHSDVLHKIDKRLVVLERWHKMMLALPALLLTILITLASYFFGFVGDVNDFKVDTRNRVTIIENKVQHQQEMITTNIYRNNKNNTNHD